MAAGTPGKTAVLLLWPNVVCYLRAVLVCVAVGIADSSEALPHVVIGLYVFSMALDGLDGALARALGQESEFGAMLDVVIDNAGRGAMWVLARGPLGVLPIFLEMLVFACTHAEGGSAWKTGCFAGAPGFISAVMKNGFRTPLGGLAVAGLHFLPLWLWLAPRLPPSHPLASPLLGAILVGGRAVAAVVELWLLLRHLGAVLARDTASLSARSAAPAAAAAPRDG